MLRFDFDLRPRSGPDAASFDIESTTTGGQLKTKAALDYEAKDTYSVKVTVSDGKDAEGDVTPQLTTQSRSQSRSRMSTKARRSPVLIPSLKSLKTQGQANIGSRWKLWIQTQKPHIWLGKPLLSVSKITPMHDLFSIDAERPVDNRPRHDLDYETQRDYEVIVTVSDGKVPIPHRRGRDNSGSLSGSPTILADGAAVVNSAPYFNRNEGDGLHPRTWLRTQRQKANIGMCWCHR